MGKDIITHKPAMTQIFRSRSYSHQIVKAWADLLIEIPQGECNSNEVCSSPKHDRNGLPCVAKCVPGNLFKPMPDFNTRLEGHADLQEYLSGRMATAVMSHPDSKTPMAVENMELDAGIAGSSRVGGAVGLTSQKTCEDCVQLTSDRLAEGTDFLSTEVKVVGSVSAGVAGILWLAALSG